jgi:hypothetical protein
MTAVWMHTHIYTNYSLGEEIMNRKLWKSIHPPTHTHIRIHNAIDHFGGNVCVAFVTVLGQRNNESKFSILHYALSIKH